MPAGSHRAEAVIDRSRFIASVGRAATPHDARKFIDTIRAEFPDATHHCWAYVCGRPGDTAIIGMSDAGEPHGTAGRPMLDVLLHSGIGEIAAVVTRYYGGVKLGTGGLVRAYGSSLQRALAALPTTRHVARVAALIEVVYADVDVMRRTLTEFDAQLVSEEYGEAVRYATAVPQQLFTAFVKALADRTAGRASVERSAE